MHTLDERICDITYPISSSPYYSEDIHTKITLGITQRILTVKARTEFAIVYPGDNEASTRIQGLIPSSTCIPLQGERRQDDERRHSDRYSRVNPVIYRKLVILRTLDSWRVETQNRLRAHQVPQSGRL